MQKYSDKRFVWLNRLERIMASAYSIGSDDVLKIWYGMTGVYPTPKDFKEKIEQLSRFDRPEIVDNFDCEHAQVVVEAMYRKAAKEKKPIRHLTGFFDPIVYENPGVLAAFNQCLIMKVPISIIVAEPDKFEANGIDFASKVKKAADDKSLKYKKFLDTEQNAHMLIVGDSGAVFRYETDPQKHTAKVSFNMESIGSGLVSDFDALYCSL